MFCVLGIDTATAVLSVAVAGKDGLLAERSALGERLHSVRLIPFIQNLLVEAGLTLRDLTGIAVSVGPGSFTGLRLGLTAAKTLAQVLHLPVVGVPTLLALAAPLLPGGIPVCPVLTSRRGEAYAAVYQANGQDIKTVVTPFAAPPSGISARLLPLREIILAGEGAWAFRAEFEEMLQGKAVFAPKIFSHPRAAVVADFGLKELAAGRGADPFSLVPEYLRPPAITGGTPCEG